MRKSHPIFNSRQNSALLAFFNIFPWSPHYRHLLPWSDCKWKHCCGWTQHVLDPLISCLIKIAFVTKSCQELQVVSSILKLSFSHFSHIICLLFALKLILAHLRCCQQTHNLSLICLNLPIRWRVGSGCTWIWRQMWKWKQRDRYQW